MSEHDYASEGGKNYFDPYAKPEKVSGPEFSPGEVVIVTYIIFNILAYSVAAISSYFLAEEIEKIISLRR